MNFALLTVLPRAVPVIAACAVLAACTVSVNPPLTLSEVVGTWENPVGVGGSITFRPDGHFNAVAVDLSDFGRSLPECQSVTDTGKWYFPNSQDSSPPSLHSAEVSLVFDNWNCNTTLITTGDSSSSSLEMCPEGSGKLRSRCIGLVVTKVS